MNTPLLSLLILLPLAGVFVVLLLPREKGGLIKSVALFSAVLSLLWSAALYYLYNPYAGPQARGFWFEENLPWFPSWGISYHLGLDGMNAAMILLSGILAVGAILASFNIRERVREYFALTLLVLTGCFGIFLSLDLFLFLLFYELASVPMYFLIGIWGSDKDDPIRPVKKEDSAMKLMLYLQLGGGLVLLGLLGVYFLSGSHTFDLQALMAAGSSLPHTAQIALFLLFFVGFGIEAGIFPFHTWLPDGHSAAPTALSMLLAGLLLKMGGYGLLRVGVGLLPSGASWAMQFLVVIAVINILYGALCALAQKDLKYMIAYSSISHMGIVLLGITTFQLTGLSGAIFQMFSHGLITALLFAGAGFIYERTHTRDLSRMGGLAARMPYVAALFTMGGLATLGLPGMSGFIAEFLVFVSAFRIYQIPTLLSILGLIITAFYVLRAIQNIFFGLEKPEYEKLTDARLSEKWALSLLALATLLFGLAPSLLIDTAKVSLLEFLLKIGGVQ